MNTNETVTDTIESVGHGKSTNVKELTHKVKPTVKPVSKPSKKMTEPKVDNTHRDFGRYRFQGVDRPKSRTALAIAQQLVSDKNPTLPELKTMLDGSIGRSSFEVILELSAAKRINSKDGKKRYFVKDEQQMKLNDGKIAVMTNQIGSENMKAFVKVAKSLGYNTVPSPLPTTKGE